MKHIRNEKGVTLIEVLASITLLSIIFIGFINFFPQMALTNTKGQEKMEAVNFAKEILVTLKSCEDLQNYLKKASGEFPNEACGYKVEYVDGMYKSTKNGFPVEIKISSESDLETTPTQAYQIHVQLLNTKGTTVLSESYGYVMVPQVEGEAN